MNARRRIITFLFAITAAINLMAQGVNSAYLGYIEQYKDLAVEQMRRYRIPASITLAQGLLESRAGQSELARKANNHFGIKVSGNWTGPYFVADDDYRNEHFRSYKSVRDSYEDHSRFLQQPRYRSLFSLDERDYRGWAYGLKRAGYATDPQYGAKLVSFIERYNLARFDRKEHPRDHYRYQVGIESPYEHRVYYYNHNYYVIARQGDTFESIGKEMGVSKRKLRRYNEVDKKAEPVPGDIIYMEKKRMRADKQFRKKPHCVQTGESMYSISQKYGMRLKNLYELNSLSSDHVLKVGEYLRVR